MNTELSAITRTIGLSGDALQPVCAEPGCAAGHHDDAQRLASSMTGRESSSSGRRGSTHPEDGT